MGREGDPAEEERREKGEQTPLKRRESVHKPADEATHAKQRMIQCCMGKHGSETPG